MTIDPREAQAAASRAHECDQPAFINIFEPALIAEFASQAGQGPLAGMPFVVKDNIDVAGIPTTAACPDLTTPAKDHAFVIKKLISAGAIPVAKTNMDQFATGLVGTRSPYGACHSAFSNQHVSGGSSSGSAIAVATNIVQLSLGTDTAGSGRVPAAFNGLVGMKPSRGLISNSGLLPACPSLDCITTFTQNTRQAAAVFDAVVGYDATDPYSRPMPASLPLGVARHMRVIAVPEGPLELDTEHEYAWQQALAFAGSIAQLVFIDVSPFLAAARLLYEAPYVSERTAAFGALLEPNRPTLDQTVRSIVLSGGDFSAVAAFTAIHELARLRRLTEATFVNADALLLPVTPWHPTLAQVDADPIGANSRNGMFTNMTNLLDLCAIALPAGLRRDGLPFGIQLLAPAFSDVPLLELASRWTGERTSNPWVPTPHRTLVAVAGAHLTGQPANSQLLTLGGHLHARARTHAGHRMFTVPGPFPRPGILNTGDGPSAGIEVEVWSLPTVTIQQLEQSIARPLHLGPLMLDDGNTVLGFVCDAHTTDLGDDITSFGSWRNYLDATKSS